MYFTNKELERLVDFIQMRQTADAENLGLASKFELEALNEYLLTAWGLVMLQVHRNDSVFCLHCYSIKDRVVAP